MWPTHLCQIPMSRAPFPCVNNMEFTSCMFTSKVNIHPFLSPFAINLPWFFMSPQNIHLGWMSPVNFVPPFGLRRPPFFVMVGTLSTSFKYFVCPSCMDNGTLSICVMGCVVSSPISINLSVFKSFVSLNHFPWLVMWFETPQFTY